MCGRHGAGLDWPEEKDNFRNNILLIFCGNKDLSGAMLPIYYGTSFLTFCQISGLKEAFEQIIKYQTALKFEFRSMHLIGQKIFTMMILRMLIFPATEICAELCCQSTMEHLQT